MNEEEDRDPYSGGYHSGILKRRKERIARNEKRLRSLYLLPDEEKEAAKKEAAAKKKAEKKAEKEAKKKNTEPGRASIRFSACKEGNHPALLMLDYHARGTMLQVVDQADNVKVEGKRDGMAARLPPPTRLFKKLKVRMDKFGQNKRTEEEQALLGKVSGKHFLPLFEDFIDNYIFPPVSDENKRKVMKQVTTLSQGKGVRYDSNTPGYAWPPGVMFRKGSPVLPKDDIPQIMEEAAMAEARFGRDRGNGWLLSHPLKKMLLFSEFVLENPERYERAHYSEYRVGTRVSKIFDGKYYDGKVADIQIIDIGEGQEVLHSVQYDDGDVEDLNEEEMNQWLYDNKDDMIAPTWQPTRKSLRTGS